MRENYINGYTVTVGTTINSSSTTLLVSAAASQDGGFRILVEAERMLVTAGGTTTTWTVTRGIEGTTGASHASGIPIDAVLTAGGLDQIRSDISGLGVYASRPVLGMKTGDRYRCTDSPYEYVYDGAAWQPFVFGYNVTEPILGSYTQMNMGASTVDGSHGGILVQPPIVSGDSLRSVLIAIPGSGAYYFDCAFTYISPVINFSTVGITFTDGTIAASSKLSYLSVGQNGGSGTIQYQRSLFTTSTSFSSVAGFTAGSLQMWGPMLWLRVFDDRTTNRLYYVSMNGYQWIQIGTESRTNFLTPAFVGMSINSNNATYNSTVHWVHASLHT
jgi:hypothetical protein